MWEDTGSRENCAKLWYRHLWVMREEPCQPLVLALEDLISSMRDHSKIIFGLFGKSQYSPRPSLQGFEDKECITGGSDDENFTSNSR